MESANAQIVDSTYNYYDVVAEKDAYYDSLIQVRSIDSLEGTGYKDYLRWKNYMGMRIDENGTMETYMELVNDYLKYIPIDTSSRTGTSQEWNYYGPTGHTDEINYTFGKGWVYCLNVNKDNHNIIYAGTHNAGLWKTMDGGKTWRCLTTNIPEVFGVKSIAIPEQDTSTIYLLSVESLSSHFNGVYKSEDSGKNWEWLELSDANTDKLYPTTNWRYFPKKIIVHPDSKDTVFVLSNHHISKSVDGGDTWSITEVYTQYPGKEMEDIIFSSGNHNIMYVSGTDVIKSIDMGSSWTNITNHFINNTNYSLKVCSMYSPNEFSDFVWFLYEKVDTWGNDQTMVVKYDPSNGGNYYKKSSTAQINYLKCSIVPSVIDTSLVYLGGQDLEVRDFDNPSYSKSYLTYYLSGDIIGVKDENIRNNNFVHVDIRDMVMAGSQDSDTLFVANDGGIRKIYWIGDTAVYIGDTLLYGNFKLFNNEDLTTKSTIGSSDLNITEVYALSNNERNNDFIYNTQDLGGYFLNNSEYYHIHYGDGGSILLDDIDADIYYYMDYQFYIKKVNGVNVEELYSSGGEYEFYFFTPIVKHPTIKDRLYIGGKHLYYFDNIYEVKSIADTILTSLPNTVIIDCEFRTDTIVKDITDIKISHNNPDIMFVATNQSYEWWSVDADCNTHDTIDANAYEKAFFKSVNGGVDWTDLSPNLLGLDRGFITDITLNPHDDDELWVTFAKSIIPENDSARRKVYHSTNGGQTFVAYDQGLPEGMPVWEMVYDPITNDLYIATDLGVFKRNVNASQWENVFLSSENDIVKLVTDLEINNKTRTLYAGTYGRGIWSTSLGECPEYSFTPVHIDSTIVWSAPKQIVSDIIVDSGAVLTITDVVFFNSNSKLIVEPGGKLELDGGVLTNSCDSDYWQGVEIRGQTNQYQSPDRQGWLVMKNYAIIENAEIGVLVGSSVPSGGPVGDGGGIVHAMDNSRFINNITGIKFEYYTFDKSVSQIEKCVFETNNDWPYIEAEPKEFIKLESHSGLIVQGCSFTNKAAPNFSTTQRGYGINSLNSEFKVDEVCISGTVPCEEYLACSFDSLYYGIYALGVTSETPIYIMNSQFRSYRGAYISAIDNALVMANDFYVPETGSGNGNAYGLYMDQSTGYTIESNAFIADEQGYQACLYINSSGTDDNLIYNNSFTGIYAAAVFEDINRKNRSGGLQVKCNDFYNNINDMAIVSDDHILTTDHGIAQSQGIYDSGNPDPLLPAGNTFSLINQSHAMDIYNDLNSIIYTYHNKDNALPKRVNPTLNTGMVSTQENLQSFYTKSNACPPSSSGGGREEIKSSMIAMYDAADSTYNEIKALTDGGDTQGLSFTVETTMQGEELQTRDLLITESPNLSDTVMIKTIEQESVMPNAMIRDVLIENPQSAKSLNVQTALDNKAEEMPGYMRVEIDQRMDSISALEVKESLLANYKKKAAANLRELILSYRTDTSLTNSKDSIAAIYALTGRLSFRYNRAMLLLSMGDSTLCDSALAAITNDFSLTEKQYSMHQDMLDYIDLLKKGTKPDSTSIVDLEEMSLNTEGKPKAYSRNILVFNGLKNYEESVILPDTSLKDAKANKHPNQSDLIEDTEEPILTLRPNPARSYFIAKYSLPLELDSPGICITDLSGNIISEINLNGKENEMIINTQDWMPGVYVVSLKDKGSVLDSKKISISR